MFFTFLFVLYFAGYFILLKTFSTHPYQHVNKQATHRFHPHHTKSVFSFCPAWANIVMSHGR